MAYITSKSYKELSPNDEIAIRQQLSKECGDYLANEYEVSVLTSIPISTLRKRRMNDSGFPFLKEKPLTKISTKPTTANPPRRRSSSSSVRYQLARIQMMTGSRLEEDKES